MSISNKKLATAQVSIFIVVAHPWYLIWTARVPMESDIFYCRLYSFSHYSEIIMFRNIQCRWSDAFVNSIYMVLYGILSGDGVYGISMADLIHILQHNSYGLTRCADKRLLCDILYSRRSNKLGTRCGWVLYFYWSLVYTKLCTSHLYSPIVTQNHKLYNAYLQRN